MLDQICKQALLLIGLRDRDLVHVEPSGLSRREEQIVRPDRSGAVTFFTGPLRVSLSSVDDRFCQVIEECCSLAAVGPDVLQADSRMGSRSRCVAIQRGDSSRAVERVL